MKSLEKFSALLGTVFFTLALTICSSPADGAPKSVSGKVNAKPLQDKASATAIATMGGVEPDSAQQQGITPSGGSSPTAPLNDQNTQKAYGLLKDIDFKRGNWMGFQKKDAAGEIVTLCGAMNHENSPFRIMFRAARNGLEVDTMDTTWSLPPDVSGETTFLVGTFHITLTMTQKNKMTLEAPITPKQLTPLLDALETEKKAVVIFGTGHRHSVNLNGAREVLTKFRQCALSHSFADIGGY